MALAQIQQSNSGGLNQLLQNSLTSGTSLLMQNINNAIQAGRADVKLQSEQEQSFLNERERDRQFDQRERFNEQNREEFMMKFYEGLKSNQLVNQGRSLSNRQAEENLTQSQRLNPILYRNELRREKDDLARSEALPQEIQDKATAREQALTSGRQKIDYTEETNPLKKEALEQTLASNKQKMAQSEQTYPLELKALEKDIELKGAKLAKLKSGTKSENAPTALRNKLVSILSEEDEQTRDREVKALRQAYADNPVLLNYVNQAVGSPAPTPGGGEAPSDDVGFTAVQPSASPPAGTVEPTNIVTPEPTTPVGVARKDPLTQQEINQAFSSTPSTEVVSDEEATLRYNIIQNFTKLKIPYTEKMVEEELQRILSGLQNETRRAKESNAIQGFLKSL